MEDNASTGAPATSGGESPAIGAAAAVAPTQPVASAAVAPQPGAVTNAVGQTASAAMGSEPAPIKWTDSLKSEHKDYVEGKGFKDPSAVLESYINLEKLRGVPQDRLLKMPETADSPEWEQLYSKLGKPDKAEGYELTVPEGEDATFVDWAKEAFHKLNMTKDQATGLIESFNQMVDNQKADGGEAYKADVQKQEMNLKKEWGQAYHQNIANAQNAAKEFGVPTEAIDAMEKSIGFDGVMKMMNSIGEKIGESKYHDGGKSVDGFGQNVLTPERAMAEISKLKGDNTFV